MEWFILVGLNLVISSIRDIYNKKILKNIEPVDYQFGYILSTNIIFGLLGLIFGWFAKFTISPLVILNSLITSAALIFYFKAIKTDDVSKVSPLQHINVIFVVILANLFLNESVGYLVFIGVFLITVGIYILHLRGEGLINPIKEIKKSNSFKFMLIYSFLISINIVLGKFLVSSIEPKTYFFVFFNLSFIFFFLYLILRRYNISNIVKNCMDKKNDIFIIGLLTSLENLTYYTALTMIYVSYISSLTRASSILTVILSSIFLKERFTKYRIAGSIIIFLGAFVILSSI